METTGHLWLGLGSNMGDRLVHLRRAVYALALRPQINPLRGSKVYETEYEGPGSQAPYLNACLEINTSLAPLSLLRELKAVEARHGRSPNGHMLPRTIDLDILLWRGLVYNHPDLLVPHPHVRERAFVLKPLADLANNEIFPDSGETIASACAKIRRKSVSWVREFELGDGGSNWLLPGAASPEASSKEDWRAALAVHCC